MTASIMKSSANLVPVLVETSGAHAGREHAVPYGEHILGRGRGATIVLDDPDVSRRHARLVVEPDGVTLFDLGSKNGMTVEGRRVDAPITLGHGDALSIGDVTLRLQHPAARVAQALAAGGEATVTMTNTRGPDAPGASLLWPIVGVLVFGTAVAVLLLV